MLYPLSYEGLRQQWVGPAGGRATELPGKPSGWSGGGPGGRVGAAGPLTSAALVCRASFGCQARRVN